MVIDLAKWEPTEPGSVQAKGMLTPEGTMGRISVDLHGAGLSPGWTEWVTFRDDALARVANGEAIIAALRENGKKQSPAKVKEEVKKEVKKEVKHEVISLVDKPHPRTGTDDDEFASPPKRTRPVKDKAGSSFVTPIDLTDTSNPTFRSGSDNIVDLTIDSDEEGDGVTKSVL
jgi:hypothetical protein